MNTDKPGSGTVSARSAFDDYSLDIGGGGTYPPERSLHFLGRRS
jgi:hypothetical protein